LAICERTYDSADKCDICGIKFGLGALKTLDHDHSSKRVRGVLCANCNLAIGLFSENVGIISNAINYIEGNGTRTTTTNE